MDIHPELTPKATMYVGGNPLVDPETGDHYFQSFVVRKTEGEVEEYFADTYRGTAMWASSLELIPGRPVAKFFSTRAGAEGIRDRLIRGWIKPQCRSEDLEVIETMRLYKPGP